MTLERPDYIKTKIDPRFNGMRVKVGEDYFPKQFSSSELNSVYYKLTASSSDEHLITESPSFEDIDEFYNPGEDQILEAITVSSYSQTDRRMAAFVRVMNRFLKGNEEGIQAQEAIVGKPRKAGNFAYVTVQIPFSDGQSISMVFHSPEGDKKKIGPEDALIAFRWLINKRDITQVVAPENGQDVSLESIGKRISQILVKNHARFVKTQKQAAEETKRLEELTSEASALEETNTELATSLTSLEEEVDTVSTKITLTESKISNQQTRNASLEAEITSLRAKKMAKSVGGDEATAKATDETGSTEPNKLALDDVLVEWKPRSRMSVPPEYRTLSAKMGDTVFRVGDVGMLNMTANVTWEGEPDPGAESAKMKLQQIKAAQADGYESYKVKYKGSVATILVKQGYVLTNDEAERYISVGQPPDDQSDVTTTKDPENVLRSSKINQTFGQNKTISADEFVGIIGDAWATANNITVLPEKHEAYLSGPVYELYMKTRGVFDRLPKETLADIVNSLRKGGRDSLEKANGIFDEWNRSTDTASEDESNPKRIDPFWSPAKLPGDIRSELKKVMVRPVIGDVDAKMPSEFKKGGKPSGYLIMNASRPLASDPDNAWNGEFNKGRFYVAIDPHGEFAKGNIEENRKLDARLLAYVDQADVDAWAEKQFGEILKSMAMKDEFVRERFFSMFDGLKYPEFLQAFNGESVPEDTQEDINTTPPDGWTEASPGGMMTSLDPVSGGIIDDEAVSGLWFVIPENDSIKKMTGFVTRAEAYNALIAEVEKLGASDADSVADVDSILDSKPWEMMTAKEVKALPEEEFQKIYKVLEDQNFHSENLFFLAKRKGTDDDILEAEDIWDQHEQAGELTPELKQRRDALYGKLMGRAATDGESEGDYKANGVHKDYVNPSSGKNNGRITHVDMNKRNDLWVNSQPWTSVMAKGLAEKLIENGDDEITFQFSSYRGEHEKDISTYTRRLEGPLKEAGFKIGPWEKVFKDGDKYFAIAKRLEPADVEATTDEPGMTKEKFAQRLIEDIKAGKQDKDKVVTNLRENLEKSKFAIENVSQDNAEPGFFKRHNDIIERNQYAIDQINAAFATDNGSDANTEREKQWNAIQSVFDDYKQKKKLYRDGFIDAKEWNVLRDEFGEIDKTSTELFRVEKDPAGNGVYVFPTEQSASEGNGTGIDAGMIRENAPQVSTPTVIEPKVSVSIRGNDVVGKGYAIPGIESLVVKVIPPNGNKSESTKMGWSIWVGDQFVYANTPMPKGREQYDTAEQAISVATPKLKKIYESIMASQATDTESSATPQVKPEQVHIDTLQSIIDGDYDNDPAGLEDKLDKAADELEKLGLMDQYDEILNRAADKAADIAIQRAKEIQ